MGIGSVDIVFAGIILAGWLVLRFLDHAVGHLFKDPSSHIDARLDDIEARLQSIEEFLRGQKRTSQS